MIGFFADPYPDELLYSACARYARRTRYANKELVAKELFGKKGFSAIVGFPNHLQHLLSTFPPGHLYTLEQLIDNHTLLPFHQPFLPFERVNLIREEMAGDSRNKLQTRLGLRARQISPQKFLRYCPKCAATDRADYAETYWHRAHQLDGIIVCAKHRCFLEDSRIELGLMAGLSFQSAETAISDKLPKSRDLNLKNKDHSVSLKIACDAEWLLANPNLQIDNRIVRDRYFNLMFKQQLAYHGGKIHTEKFLAVCRESFSDEIFEMIGKISLKKNWLTVLIDEAKTGKTFHPVRHLLLMTCLGLTAEEFFNSYVEFKPFGEPPYPCLNKASDHYGELRIQEGKILNNFTRHEQLRRPLAVFKCDCGFIYQRLGPDESEDDKFRYDLVREYGLVWEKKLTELWKDLSVTATEIGKQIGIQQASVVRHAIRLQLPMNVEGARKIKGYAKHRNPKKAFSEMLQEYRKTWLELRIEHPNLTRKELSNINGFLYVWLRRNDFQWFEEHLPPSRWQTKKDVLDWSEIDQVLSAKIKGICREVKNLPGEPIRASLSEITRRVGHNNWLSRRKTKLSLTNQILAEHLETWEEFMLRKINWAKNTFIEQKKMPSLSQLKGLAGVRNHTSNNSRKIQKALQDTIIEIANVQNTIYLHWFDSSLVIRSIINKRF